jgi:hypothetical protein
MSALGNPAWAIPYAAAAGGAAGGIVGSALSGGNIGQAAAAGAVGGAIGSVMPIIGPMIGSGVASEMVGGDFLEGVAQGAACVISSAIASGAFQTAIDVGREERGIEGSAGTSRTISEQLIRPPSTYNVSRVNARLFGDFFRSDPNSLLRLQLMVIKSAVVGGLDTVVKTYYGIEGVIGRIDKVNTTLKTTTGKGILGHIEDYLESHSYRNSDRERKPGRFPPFI